MSTNEMNYEVNRKNTFNDVWPHAYINPRLLARTGFYYIGPYDQVKCNFCGLQVHSWENPPLIKITLQTQFNNKSMTW